MTQKWYDGQRKITKYYGIYYEIKSRRTTENNEIIRHILWDNITTDNGYIIISAARGMQN